MAWCYLLIWSHFLNEFKIRSFWVKLWKLSPVPCVGCVQVKEKRCVANLKQKHLQSDKVSANGDIWVPKTSKFPSKASFEIFGTLVSASFNPDYFFYTAVGYHYLKPCHNYYNENYNYNSNIVVTIVTITCLCSTHQADQENSQVQNQTVKRNYHMAAVWKFQIIMNNICGLFTAEQ